MVFALEALKGTPLGTKLEFLEKVETVAAKMPGAALSLVLPKVETAKAATLQEIAETPRYYPFGVLPGGLVATGGVEGVPDEHKIGYVRETPEGKLSGGLLPAETAAGTIPIQPGDITYVTYLPGEVIIPDIPGVTHFRERYQISERINWLGQKIEIPSITFPKFPDITEGIKKALIIAAVAIGGLFLLGKFIGRKK